MEDLAWVHLSHDDTLAIVGLQSEPDEQYKYGWKCLA
jgi:hypothetical protein